MARPKTDPNERATESRIDTSDEFLQGQRELIASLVPGPLSRAWASMVMARYCDGAIDVAHESAIAHGALLSLLLDGLPTSADAKGWSTELRQVRRELMGEEDEGVDPAATESTDAQKLLERLTFRRS